MQHPDPEASKGEPFASLNPTTVALLGRCQEGDRHALEELASRFYAPVRRMVRTRMGPILMRKEELDDLVQETFLELLASLDGYEARADAHFVAYLAKIAHRTVAGRVDYYATQKRDAQREATAQRKSAESGVSRPLIADTTSIPAKAAKSEMEEVVDECVAGLDDTHREVILLRDYAGADWEFIQAELDRPSVSAVQQLHFRARKKLSECVRRRS